MISTGEARVQLGHWTIYLVVALIALAVFLPWAQLYFLGDDWMEMARNSGLPLPVQLQSINDAANSRGYRPLSESSLSWPWPLFGLNPTGYHLIAYALHALSAALVGALGERLTGDRRAGLLAGVLFAVLGCHTEAVVWLSARNELWATALALLSFVSYIKFRDSDRFAWWVGTFTFYILSLLAKETTLSLPLFLILYDLMFVFPLQRNGDARSLARHQVIPWLPVAALGSAYLLFRLMVGGGYDVPVSVLALPKNLIYYLLMQILALPVSTHLVVRFPFVTLPVMASLLLACASVLWLSRWRLIHHRPARFGVVWMIFALAPVILIVAERTTYFSSIGWAWIIASAMILAWDAVRNLHPSPQRSLVVVAVVAIAGTNLITIAHRSYWWNRAGDISRDLASQVQSSLLGLTPDVGGEFWFFNLPEQTEYAYYPPSNRILFAVWLLQRQASTVVQAEDFQNVEIASSPSQHLKRILSERPAHKPVVAFYWHGGAIVKLSTLHMRR